MTKKMLAGMLAFAILLSIVPMAVYAQAPEGDDINASYYLSSYGVLLYSNGTSGKLKLDYEVYATNTMNTVGVYKIVVRKANGSVYKTIWGSTANGLEASNTWYKVGTYTLSLASGNSYYCDVTVIAANASGSDTRTITTSLVTCP